MAATRRDKLESFLRESGKLSDDSGSGDTSKSVGTEEGFPFGVLSGSPVADSAPPVETRVKPPTNSEKPKKESKTPRVGTATERTLAEIADSLAEKADTVSAAIAPMAPVTSVYLAEHSPRAITALVNIGKRRPGVLKALSKVADGIDAVELARFVLGTLTALQVDFGRLKGDEPPARVLGVTAIMDEYFKSDDMPNPAVTFQAPKYVPV